MDRAEKELFGALREITLSALESSAAVLAAVAKAIRDLVPAIDSVLIYTAGSDAMECAHASGHRAECFLGSHVRRDRFDLLPALASVNKHRVFAEHANAIIPGDRWCMAIPIDPERGAPVVYAGSLHGVDHARAQEIVGILALHAGAPYRIASEREADRASATFDALTGLFTPRAFRDRLAVEIENALAARNYSVALWFVDTDNFKRVNDSRGHAAGDVVLQRIAALLQSALVPHCDVAARNGGDEFCAIVRGVEKIAAIERAQQLCDAIREADAGGDIPITASIGVAVFPYDASDSASLLEAADGAMYHSKNCGRDRVSFAVSPSVYAAYR